MIRKLREFQIGQVIRQEGPTIASAEGRHADDGRAADPDGGARADAALGGPDERLRLDRGADDRGVRRASASLDDYLKIVRRDHHGLRPRYKMALAGRSSRSSSASCCWCWRRTGAVQHPADLPVLQEPDSGSRLVVPAVRGLRARRGVERGQPDRRPRRPGDQHVRDRRGDLHRAGVRRPGTACLPSTCCSCASRQSAELTIFCGALVGASLGFLWYNAYPAEIFMGDVGSLALGAALGTVAILIKQELLLVIVGGVFVLEALSVVIQVASFKLTGKRVFRMAPLHHHFELIGWSEPKVIARFVIVGDHLRAVQPDDVEAAVMGDDSRSSGQAGDGGRRGAQRDRGGGAARRARRARHAVGRASRRRRGASRLTALGVDARARRAPRRRRSRARISSC